MGSWGTLGRMPRSWTPVESPRLALRTNCGAGSCCCRRLSPSCRCLSPHHRSRSRRLAAHRCCRRCLAPRRLRQRSLSRSSITRPAPSLSTLRSLPSRSRGRRATQDSLPGGGQPLPCGTRTRRVPNEVSAVSTWHPPHPSFPNASRRRDRRPRRMQSRARSDLATTTLATTAPGAPRAPPGQSPAAVPAGASGAEAHDAVIEARRHERGASPALESR